MGVSTRPFPSCLWFSWLKLPLQVSKKSIATEILYGAGWSPVEISPLSEIECGAALSASSKNYALNQVNMGWGTITYKYYNITISNENIRTIIFKMLIDSSLILFSFVKCMVPRIYKCAIFINIIDNSSTKLNIIKMQKT